MNDGSWYDMDVLKRDPAILSIDDTYPEWITAVVDPKIMDKDGLYCLICDDFGWYDYEYKDIQDGILYGHTHDGTCRGAHWEPLHRNMKTQFFKVEDHQIIPLSKVELLQNTSRKGQHKGLLARIRTLLMSKAGKEGNDGYRIAGPYMLDPTFVPVWDDYMTCPMCQEPADGEFFADIEDSLKDRGMYNEVFFRLYKQGIHYEDDTGDKYHLVEQFQHCPIEDMNKNAISKLELIGGSRNVPSKKKKTHRK